MLYLAHNLNIKLVRVSTQIIVNCTGEQTWLVHMYENNVLVISGAEFCAEVDDAVNQRRVQKQSVVGHYLFDLPYRKAVNNVFICTCSTSIVKGQLISVVD